jgi:hypothetical protein
MPQRAAGAIPAAIFIRPRRASSGGAPRSLRMQLHADIGGLFAYVIAEPVVDDLEAPAISGVIAQSGRAELTGARRQSPSDPDVAAESDVLARHDGDRV